MNQALELTVVNSIPNLRAVDTTSFQATAVVFSANLVQLYRFMPGATEPDDGRYFIEPNVEGGRWHLITSLDFGIRHGGVLDSVTFTGDRAGLIIESGWQPLTVTIESDGTTKRLWLFKEISS